MTDFENARWAVGQLRHLYELLLKGLVRDQAEAARGLLGPAITRLEPLTTAYVQPPGSESREARDAEWTTAIREAANCIAPRPAEPGFRVHSPADRPRCGCSPLRALLGSPSDARPEEKK